MSNTPPNLKLLLIGNSSVGKSSLLLRFTDDDFLPEDEASATIGVDFKVKSLDLDGQTYKLSIWDTAGQERFRSLTSSYYRGAEGVILVYDVTSRKTFDELPKWLREIETYCVEGVGKMIVGNKVDKEVSRQVSTEEGEEFARQTGSLFIECSAKSNLYVVEAFQELVRTILSAPALSLSSSGARLSRASASREIDLQQDGSGWMGGCSC